MSITSVYSPVVICPLRCADVVRDVETNIPRGFFSLASPGAPLAVLAVALNPGQPSPLEGSLYAGKTPKLIIRAHLEHGRKTFLGPAGTKFHSRLVAWLADALQTSPEQVFQVAAYTNLVKCTTVGNRLPGAQTRATCSETHLYSEIKSWRPKVIVALGSEVTKALGRMGIAHEYLPHPSHRERANYHQPYVAKLRDRLKNAI